MLTIISKSEKDTFNLGYRLGKLLKSGDIVCLIGDLGAGKTTLTKSIAEGLEVDDYITSPTFSLVNEYDGRVHLNHFDVYRINDIDELYDIGFDEYIYSDSVTIIEWANLIEEILPKEKIILRIDKTDNDNEREITISGYGNRYEEIVNNLR